MGYGKYRMKLGMLGHLGMIPPNRSPIVHLELPLMVHDNWNIMCIYWEKWEYIVQYYKYPSWNRQNMDLQSSFPFSGWFELSRMITVHIQYILQWCMRILGICWDDQQWLWYIKWRYYKMGYINHVGVSLFHVLFPSNLLRQIAIGVCCQTVLQSLRTIMGCNLRCKSLHTFQ